jgi:hypothetical protein
MLLSDISSRSNCCTRSYTETNNGLTIFSGMAVRTTDHRARSFLGEDDE